MSMNSAAHQKKVEHAVRKILKAPDLSIPDAMVLANFLKKDVANETVRRAVHRAVKLRRDWELLDLCAPLTDGIVIIKDPVTITVGPVFIDRWIVCAIGSSIPQAEAQAVFVGNE